MRKGWPTDVVRGALALVWNRASYLLIILAFAWMNLRVEPIARNGLYGTHYYRLILACISIALAVSLFMVGRVVRPDSRFPQASGSWPGGPVARILNTLLVLACIFGVFNYYQFDSKNLFGIGDHADVTYYYVNSKYFAELGYFELYPAMIIADREGQRHLLHVKLYRDLHTYQVVDTDHAVLQADVIKRRFTRERWEAFKHDVGFLVKRGARGGWAYFFTDHGYNPPPTWTIVGGTLSKLVSVEHVKVITMVDFVLIVFMFAAIGRTYGMQAMLFALLFFLSTFSGRWPILGQSLLRFDWLAALILAVCMLKVGRHGWAGGFLTYAALSRVFPTIFLWPYAVVALHHLIKRRRFAREHHRFLVGSLIVQVCLILGALIVLRPDAFAESKRNLLMHGSPQSYSSHRVGLGDALFYRGEKTRDDLARHGGIAAKAERITRCQGLLYGLGIASLVFIALYAVRTGKPACDLIYLSILPLFCMQTPQINYYNMRLLLVLAHMGDTSRFRHKLGLVLLFLIEVITQYSHVLGNWRYTTTCMTSIGLAAYFAVMLVFLTRDFVHLFGKAAPRAVTVPRRPCMDGEMAGSGESPCE